LASLTTRTVVVVVDGALEAGADPLVVGETVLSATVVETGVVEVPSTLLAEPSAPQEAHTTSKATRIPGTGFVMPQT
jgi:hypothetical protein